MHLTEKTVNREIKFEGKIFTVAIDDVLLEDGSPAKRELVLHHGGAGILPVENDGTITLVRQYRSGVAKQMTEICAGKLEEGEDALEGALRELEEELGIRAGNVIPLGAFAPTPAYDSEITHVFLATDLSYCERHTDEGEFLDIVTMSLDEAVSLVMNGEISDGKTQLAILKAERILRGKN